MPKTHLARLICILNQLSCWKSSFKCWASSSAEELEIMRSSIYVWTKSNNSELLWVSLENALYIQNLFVVLVGALTWSFKLVSSVKEPKIDWYGFPAQYSYEEYWASRQSAVYMSLLTNIRKKRLAMEKMCTEDWVKQVGDDRNPFNISAQGQIQEKRDLIIRLCRLVVLNLQSDYRKGDLFLVNLTGQILQSAPESRINSLCDNKTSRNAQLWRCDFGAAVVLSVQRWLFYSYL